MTLRVKPLSLLNVLINEDLTFYNKTLISPIIYDPIINDSLYIFDINGNLYFRNVLSDKDIHIQVNDGGTITTPFTIDGSTSRIGIGNTAPLSILHVGDSSNQNSTDPTVLISRIIDDSGSGSSHAISDSSLISRTGVVSYASYDANAEFTGAANYGHYVSFQANPIFGSSGTIGDLYCYSSTPTINIGTATRVHGIRVNNPAGTGTVGTAYGIYIESQTKGGTNYQIRSVGTAPSRFSGPIGIGEDPSSSALFLKYDNGFGNTQLLMRNFTNNNDWAITVGTTSLQLVEVGLATRMYLADGGKIGIGGNVSPQVGLHVGTNTTTHSLSAISDVMITGNLEVDGNSYFDSNTYMGTTEFETNSGLVTALNMPVSSAAVVGTEEAYTFDLDGLNVLKVYAESDGIGSIQNRGVHFYGTTGVIKRFVYQNDSLADDGTVNLPDAVSGMVTVTCNAEAGQWLVQQDGTCTKVSGTTNTADTDSDTDLCVYDGGTFGIVKNRLGATGRIRIIFEYN